MEQKFLLKKASIDEWSVECNYKIVETAEDGTETTTEYSQKCTRPPHKDLLTQIEVLAEVMRSFLKTERNVSVEKVAFSGKEDKRGIVLSGTMDGRIRYKTPKLHLSGDSDQTVMLSCAAEILTEEVRLYLDGKQADVGVFGE